MLTKQPNAPLPQMDVLRNEYRLVSKPRHAGLSEFIEVVKTNWRVLSIGLFLGLLFAGFPAIFEHWSHEHPVGGFFLGLFEHLGIGLIVAALAVIAYEWVSEARRAQIHSSELVHLLMLGAKDRLESTHKMLLGPNADHMEPLRDFTASVATIADADDWLSKPLVAFFSHVASKASQNAKSLEHVVAELRTQRNTAARFPLVFAEPPKLTDFILEQLLLALPPGSRYSAVSNALIWKDLTDFRDSHENAIEAGVTIQRIFIIFQKADAVTADAQAIATIYAHYDLSQKWGVSEKGGRYQTRFVTAEQYDKKAPRLAQRKHFGVFRPPDRNALAFDVIDDDLSKFDILAAGPASEFTHDFDELWKVLPELDDISLRYLLRAERMRRIDSGSYSAVSTFENWTQERLNRLHEDSMEAEIRGVEVRRIFVMGEKQSTSEMVRVLDAHALSSHDHPGYKWVACEKEKVPPALTSLVHIPYGIFKDRGKSGSTQQVLFEVYSGRADEPFELSGEVAENMLKDFERSWKELWRNRAELLQERFGPEKAREWA
jgi:hypothetical protein